MRRSTLCRAGILFLTLLCVQLAMLQSAAASSGKIIYSFAGGADGAYPESDLILDTAGNLYGTTSQGGTGNCGTVFELIRTQAGWKHQVLYSFNGGPSDGCGPTTGLVFDSTGDLYGTTSSGGANNLGCSSPFGGCGTVFKLTPNSQSGWNESVLYNFGSFCGDGEVHYGWARLNVGVTSTRGRRISATLTGYAYETVANKPILTGKTKGPDVVTVEPATLGHLAQGASQIQAWRGTNK